MRGYGEPLISGKPQSLQTISTAVILAGGGGLRLRPLTNHLPKAMIPLAGKPIIGWIIEWLLRNGISRIVVGVAYKKEIVTEYLSSLSLGVEFKISEHTVEGGTGEGFRLAIQRHVDDNAFLAMNGDEITNIPISEFADFHLQNGGLATIAVSHLRSPFGVVEISGNKIVGFREKAVLDAYVSSGVYIFDHGIMPFLPVKGNVEADTFPKLAQDGKLSAYKHTGFWGTVNTFKDLREIELNLMNGVLLNQQNQRTLHD
jgi:NDP-sugar pyrophosphorylase family protein